MFNALGSRPALAAAAGLAAVGLAAFFVIVSRNAASGPQVVVADAVAASEQGAAPSGDPGEDRTVAEPTAQPKAPTEPPSGAKAQPAVPSAAPASAAPEAEPLVLEPVLSDPRSERTVGSSAASPVPGAQASSFSSTIEALKRQQERLKAQLESLPDEGGAVDAIEGALTVTADRPLVDRRAVTADRAMPAPPLPQATGPIVVGEALVAREGEVGVAKSFHSAWEAGEAPARRQPDTEAFANEPASPLNIASEQPVSTFSIDVDTASYSVLRSSLMNGYLPAAEAVRIEEMVNYFPYAYPAPGAGEAPFRSTVSVSETPWNPDTLLMQIGIQGRLPAMDDRPPLNLVFLIDTSGSMNQPNKLPLLKQSFRLMLGQLRPADQVAIVTYAGSAGRALEATAASDRGAILAALDRLDARGSTAGAAGIQLAYATAAGMAAEGEVTRVILATDGDFNVGISDPEQLEGFIARQRDSGVYLSVLGFGRGNLDDATMQALAQNGNGQAGYIDTLAEAQKVLVDQLTGTLFPIADDVKIQVEFNPAAVAEYRLIGYETRALRREDFNNDRVDAGEIGAGHSVTAIYEVTPVGSAAVLHDPLRYAAPVAEPPGAAREPAARGELAFLRLRYKEPGEDTSRLIELPVGRGMGDASGDTRFAAAIAGFGQLLKNGAYMGDWSYADAIALAEANTGDDRFGYRREAVTLMRLAESLTE